MNKLSKYLKYLFNNGVIEEYTVARSGITWQVRKWANGRAECWGSFGSGSFAPNQTTFNNSTNSRVLSPYGFPPSLFTAVPQAIFNLNYWGTGYYYGTISNITADTFSLRVYKSNAASDEGYGSIYAWGRWK